MDLKEQLKIQLMYDQQIKSKKTDVEVKDDELARAKRRLKAHKRKDADIQGNRF